jgi:hypothetical protein
MIFILTQYYLGNEIKKSEMGDACGMWVEDKCVQVFGGSLEEREGFENLDVDGRIMLKWFFKMRKGGMDWFGLFKIGTGGGIL